MYFTYNLFFQGLILCFLFEHLVKISVLTLNSTLSQLCGLLKLNEMKLICLVIGTKAMFSHIHGSALFIDRPF